VTGVDMKNLQRTSAPKLNPAERAGNGSANPEGGRAVSCSLGFLPTGGIPATE
jgi:hypothetical protein